MAGSCGHSTETSGLIKDKELCWMNVILASQEGLFLSTIYRSSVERINYT
jgi:hypothetical protein